MIQITPQMRIVASVEPADVCRGIDGLARLCKAYRQLTELLKDKSTLLARLRNLLFGLQTEKTKAVIGNGKDSSSLPPQSVTASTLETAAAGMNNIQKTPPKGRGRFSFCPRGCF